MKIKKLTLLSTKCEMKLKLSSAVGESENKLYEQFSTLVMSVLGNTENWKTFNRQTKTVRVLSFMMYCRYLGFY